jgi:hypothetical protein
MDIKRLEWVLEDENWWSAKAHCFPFSYEVWVTGRGTVRFRTTGGSWIKSSLSADDLMFSLQKDYEDRVMGSFE